MAASAHDECVRSFMKQRMDWVLFVPREIATALNAQARASHRAGNDTPCVAGIVNRTSPRAKYAEPEVAWLAPTQGRPRSASVRERTGLNSYPFVPRLARVRAAELEGRPLLSLLQHWAPIATSAVRRSLGISRGCRRRRESGVSEDSAMSSDVIRRMSKCIREWRGLCEGTALPARESGEGPRRSRGPPDAREGGKLSTSAVGGFHHHLARDLFDEIHGLDVTPAMLAKIDTRGTSPCTTRSGTPPFWEGAFDVVTGYAFLHHLEDFRPCCARRSAC